MFAQTNRLLTDQEASKQEVTRWESPRFYRSCTTGGATDTQMNAFGSNPDACVCAWMIETPARPFFRDNNQLELGKKNKSNNELFCTSEGNWAVSAVLLKSCCIYYILNDFCCWAKVGIHNAFWLKKKKKKAVEKICTAA